MRPSWVVVVGALTITAMAVGTSVLSRPSGTRAHPANTMAVDAIPYQVDDDGDGLFDEDPGGLPHQGEGVDADVDGLIDEDDPTTTANSVDASRTVGGPIPLDVSVNVTWSGSAEDRWHAYQLTLAYDDSILAFVPTLDTTFDQILDSWAYTGLGGGTIMDATVTEYDRDEDGKTDALCGGSLRYSGTSDAGGQALVARFRCIANGTSPLHLVTLAEDPVCGSATMETERVPLPTNLVDAGITCSLGTPTPSAVGGIAERPPLAVGAPDRELGAAAEGSFWLKGRGAAVAVGLIVGVGAAAAGAWFMQRRSLW